MPAAVVSHAAVRASTARAAASNAALRVHVVARAGQQGGRRNAAEPMLARGVMSAAGREKVRHTVDPHEPLAFFEPARKREAVGSVARRLPRRHFNAQQLYVEIAASPYQPSTTIMVTPRRDESTPSSTKQRQVARPPYSGSRHHARMLVRRIANAMIIVRTAQLPERPRPPYARLNPPRAAERENPKDVGSRVGRARHEVCRSAEPRDSATGARKERSAAFANAKK